jgi:hypothetical protein
VPWHLHPNFQKKGKKQPEEQKPTEEVVYQRYYHLFKKGELDSLIESIPQAKVIESVWDHENWYVLTQKD